MSCSNGVIDSLSPAEHMSSIGIVTVDWEVTFKRDFTMDGHTFTAGQTMTLDASLVRADDGRWLINGI